MLSVMAPYFFLHCCQHVAIDCWLLHPGLSLRGWMRIKIVVGFLSLDGLNAAVLNNGVARLRPWFRCHFLTISRCWTFVMRSFLRGWPFLNWFFGLGLLASTLVHFIPILKVINLMLLACKGPFITFPIASFVALFVVRVNIIASSTLIANNHGLTWNSAHFWKYSPWISALFFRVDQLWSQHISCFNFTRRYFLSSNILGHVLMVRRIRFKNLQLFLVVLILVWKLSLH